MCLCPVVGFQKPAATRSVSYWLGPGKWVGVLQLHLNLDLMTPFDSFTVCRCRHLGLAAIEPLVCVSSVFLTKRAWKSAQSHIEKPIGQCVLLSEHSAREPRRLHTDLTFVCHSTHIPHVLTYGEGLKTRSSSDPTPPLTINQSPEQIVGDPFVAHILIYRVQPWSLMSFVATQSVGPCSCLSPGSWSLAGDFSLLGHARVCTGVSSATFRLCCTRVVSVFV